MRQVPVWFLKLGILRAARGLRHPARELCLRDVQFSYLLLLAWKSSVFVRLCRPTAQVGRLCPADFDSSSPCPHQCDPCSDEGLRQSLLSLFFICCWTNLPGAQLSSCPCLSSDQSLTPPHVPTAFRLSSLPALVSPGGTSSAASQIGLLIAPPNTGHLLAFVTFHFSR